MPSCERLPGTVPLKLVVDDNALPSEPAGTPGSGLAFGRVIPPTGPPARPLSGTAASFSFTGPIATFSDSTGAGIDPTIYHVNIDWGDTTTSPGTVAYDPNLAQFIVSASHTFAQAAGTTADVQLQVTNTSNGNVAGLEDLVTLQAPAAAPAQLGFDQATYAAARNGAPAAITVVRSGDTTLESTVDYHVSGGTAVSGTDFLAGAGTLTFMPGQTQQTFLLPVYADPTVAVDQTVSLVLSFPTGNANLGSQSTAILTIHPSATVFAPNPPTLPRTSDTGTSNADGVTANDGSPQAPLTLDLAGASIPNGFVQFYDVTDPASPIAIGSPTQASRGTATLTLQSTGLVTGTHQIAAASAATATSAWSPLSAPLTVTIDTIAPTSAVTALPLTTTATAFSVSWAGTDNAAGSGIATYDVFVSDNGGAWAPFAVATTATSATFTGLVGHSYGFTSVATDNAGNVQATPASPQATTQIVAVVVPPSPAVLQFASTQFVANVTDGSVQVVISRAGNLSAGVSVVLSSPGGNGVASFQETIAFGPNVASQSITIPIQNDGQPGRSDSVISLTLSSAATGATLGATTTANLVIHDNNPLPRPVIILSAQPKTMTVGKGRKAKKQTVVVLQLSAALNASAAQDASAYHFLSGKTKKHVTTYGHPVSPTSASYDAALLQITLFPAGKLNLALPQELKITSALLTDLRGRPLDGNHDGQPGGDFAATLSKGAFTILSVKKGPKIPPLNTAAVDHVLLHGHGRPSPTRRSSP